MLQLIALLVVVCTAVWVGFDAPKRNWPGKKPTSTAVWVIGILLLWIVVFPIYLFQRGKSTEKGVVATGNVAPLAQPEMYRACPHCKEGMRRDAGVCPHCRNHSAAWTLHGGYWWFRSNEQEGWQWFDEPNGRWLKHALPSTPPASDPAGNGRGGIHRIAACTPPDARRTGRRVARRHHGRIESTRQVLDARSRSAPGSPQPSP